MFGQFDMKHVILVPMLCVGTHSPNALRSFGPWAKRCFAVASGDAEHGNEE